MQDDTSGRAQGSQHSQPSPESPEQAPPAPKINTDVPHSARIWNYWLGGVDNYEVDRVAGEEYKEVFPEISFLARTSRHFLARAVRFLAGEADMRQFLDVGTGLPTVDNTHEVAQRVAPESRIVYVDNDPLVLAHARALLTSTSEGSTTYLDADLHRPEQIVARARKVLDFDRPVALMLMGITGHIVDAGEARSIVRTLVDALPSGSYFTLYDFTSDNPVLNQAQTGYDDTGAVPYVLRSHDHISSYFEGLEVVEPGIVTLRQWRPEIEAPDAKDDPTLCAVARKP
ncbi:SAM-dependent methyltransferase [Actinomadura vinacea]|uniref:SAM-dependent methyltransferase n=1 Tax=Actinomadura vinacea TaxID=115336 RepID=A0ABN3KL24_9ACTN